MTQKIVVIGAGYAGLLTAKKLAKKLKRDDVEISIIDKSPFHTMLTELHEVAAGRVDESSIRINIKKVFAGRKVNVILDKVEQIDFDNKTIHAVNTDYAYDYLVIASGSKPNFFGVEGAKEYTHTLWSYDDAVNLKKHIDNTFLTAHREANVEKRKLLLTFYVIGAGFTGVEMMGELAEYVPILCDKYSIDINEVNLVQVDFLPRAVPNLPEKLSKKVETRLDKMGVKMKFNHMVTKVGADFIELKQKDSEEITKDPVHTVIWTAGIQSSDVSTTSANSLELNKANGRIETDAYLRAKGYKDVFVAGDNIFYLIKNAQGKEVPVPQIVENAEHSAATVAKNITASIKGHNKFNAYKPSFHGLMVCVGGRYGVARVGLDKFQINLPSFFAMFVKHFINIVYFMQILGWNKVFSYLTHEIFTIRNKRSFVGGHFSNRTPSCLVVPIRIWLGIILFTEAIKKMHKGWYSFDPKLKDFLGGATKWWEHIGASDYSIRVANKTARFMGDVIFNFDFYFFKIILASSKPLANSDIGDFALKIDMPLVNWLMDNIILAYSPIQVIMQMLMLSLEFLVAFSLMSGLFTTMFAFIACSLFIMFMMTTGLYISTLWMLFAAIAVICAGRTFGLDYWVMPKLKHWWKNIAFVKKWYLYND